MQYAPWKHQRRSFLLKRKTTHCPSLSACVVSVQWIFWVGPLIGAAIAAAYHQYVLRASAAKLGSYRSNA